MVHEVKTQNQGKYKIFHPVRKGAKNNVLCLLHFYVLDP